MRTCKKCGMQIPDGGQFCGVCGERYVEYTSAPAYQPQTTRPASSSSSAEGFLKILPLIVSVLGFIIAWESDWVFGLIVCVGATVYAYTRYNNFKSSIDKLSLAVSAGVSGLIILLMLFL